MSKMLPVILLSGPTASGKTAIALELASRYSVEIISVDSAMIYQGMNIGTAKPAQDVLAQFPHHLVNIRTVLENYSVAEFVANVNDLIQSIWARGKVALLVGGTMMYYHALFNGLSDLPPTDYTVRAKLQDELNEYGLAHLYERLRQYDSASAATIHPNDKQRILRALEVYNVSKTPLSQLLQQARNNGGILQGCNCHFIALMPHERTVLYELINARCVSMFREGFIDEVVELKRQYPTLTGEYNSLRCVGYSQTHDYLNGAIKTYSELVSLTQFATCNLAKRQMTWLRKLSPYLSSTISDASVSTENALSRIIPKLSEWLEAWQK